MAVVVTLTAQQVNGAALPGWMSFNPQNGTFEGTPPPGFRGEVTVIGIDHTAVRSLADPELAVPYGGAISARFDNKSLVPDLALYRVRLAVAGQAVSTPVRGQMLMNGERRSLVDRVFRAAAAVVIREWGA